MNDFDEVQALQDQRTQRAAREAAAQAQTLPDRQAQTTNAPDETEGYWDAETGTFKNFFRLGISKFGGPDVLK